jgi:hypothetical protein
VRDRRALVAGHIGHARLQQRLGHGQDAFAVELGAVAELQLLYLFLERAFCHPFLANPEIRLYSMLVPTESARILRAKPPEQAVLRAILSGRLQEQHSEQLGVAFGDSRSGRTPHDFRTATHGVSCRTAILLSAGVSPRKFSFVLIKPSHYGDDGYVIRWWRTTIPSNSLAAVYGIASDCAERQVLGPGRRDRIEAIDESNTRVDVPACWRFKRNGGFGSSG